MQDQLFADRGIAYRVNTFSPEKETLLLIHGLSGSASAWSSYEKQLSERCNLLIVDLRGHGFSKKYPHYADYALIHFADDVFALLQFLNIEHCSLVSYSFGALVALELIEAHPSLVSRTIFLSPMVYLRDRSWHRSIRLIARSFAGLFELFPRTLPARGRVDYTNYTPTTDWDLWRISADLRMTSLRVYMSYLAQAYATDADDRWGRLTLPTLIVHGTRDTYIPLEHAKRLAAAIPHAKLKILEGANHIIVLNNQADVLEAILSFKPA